jgi:hypothetical protein
MRPCGSDDRDCRPLMNVGIALHARPATRTPLISVEHWLPRKVDLKSGFTSDRTIEVFTPAGRITTQGNKGSHARR